jgi:hypothetical protein
MINCTTFKGNALLRTFVEGNGIKSAFVWREGKRHWQVFEGDAEKLTGFLAGEFKTKREAEELKQEINNLIKAL